MSKPSLLQILAQKETLRSIFMAPAFIHHLRASRLEVVFCGNNL